MAVHQLLPTFSAGDATSQSAVHLRLLLRRLGLHGELFAGEIRDQMEALVAPWDKLNPRPDDLVLYHHGIGSGLCARLMQLRCRRGVVFHNITPVRRYQGGTLAEQLTAGRAQLAVMAPHMDIAVGVSNFNSAELREAGYRNVHTVPLFVEPRRFGEDKADSRLLARLKAAGPTLMTVSRVVPHKRFEDLVALHREVLHLRPQARLLLAGGFAQGDSYYRSLLQHAKDLDGVRFLGRLSHAELVAAYRSATLFVSMSEHEGFGVPLLEAMASDVPVLAYGAAAVPETLGGHGVAFTEKDFPLLAQIAVELSEDQGLRAPLLRGQHERLEELSAENAQARLSLALQSIGVRGKPKPRRKRSSASRPRVGLIVQRFGDVGGGAERHAEQVATRLLPHVDLTILTSCARDHLSWENDFPSGSQQAGPFEIVRFATNRSRKIRAFNALSRRLFGTAQDRMHEEQWIAEQGPLMPGLYRHLAEEGPRYDAFIGFTFLYAPLVWGVPMVASKMLVVPTAHDEPPLAFEVYRDVFERPRALLCNTPEELQLIHRRFPNHARARVVGVGVDAPTASAERFASRFDQRRPYLLYVGRIEQGKGVGELLRHHAELVAREPDAPDLLLAGHSNMSVSGRKVRYLGRITDEEKFDGLAGAVAAVVPSRYESLSLLTLEAFAQGTPVLANKASEVLVGQVTRSGAGTLYAHGAEFAEGVRRVVRERESFGSGGRAFVRAFQWPAVTAAYLEEIDAITRSTP